MLHSHMHMPYLSLSLPLLSQCNRDEGCFSCTAEQPACFIYYWDILMARRVTHKVPELHVSHVSPETSECFPHRQLRNPTSSAWVHSHLFCGATPAISFGEASAALSVGHVCSCMCTEFQLRCKTITQSSLFKRPSVSTALDKRRKKFLRAKDRGPQHVMGGASD